MRFIAKIFDGLNWVGSFLPQLAIRFLLAYEFWESGITKFNADKWPPNWFGQVSYPVPFDQIPTLVNWHLVMWTELVGAVLLVIGFATRFTALALIILDVVAWVSVHAGNGYNVCDNGFKLPLMFLVLLLPLLFSGPGRASIDHLIAKRTLH